MKTSEDDDAVNKATATTHARTLAEAFFWYVPHYTPKSTQTKLLWKHFVSRHPAEICYKERPVLQDYVNATKGLECLIRNENWKWGHNFRFCWFLR